jgi:adenylate cyclase class 2
VINVEIKARCSIPHQEAIRFILLKHPDIIRTQTQRQVDTYFNVPNGRLKIRESPLENYLIRYDRPNQGGPKVSKYDLVPCQAIDRLKVALTTALGVKAVVDKTREIYFIGNVKFHLDSIRGLGTFVEIEARDENETIGEAKLHEQCRHWMVEFAIAEDDLLSYSYSDMILRGGDDG